jgi:hypothetical protein
MRSMLLTALAGTVLAGLFVSPAEAARGSDAYQATVVAQVQAERAERGLTRLHTRGRAARCLDRIAQRWAERQGVVRPLDAVARRCEVDRVRSLRYASEAGPSEQAARLLSRASTRRPLLAAPREPALGFGHARSAGEHRVVLLVGSLPPGPSVDPELTRLGVVDLVNAERAAAGKAPVTVDACLMANAQRHAERLARTGRLAHQDLGRIAEDCGTRDDYGENVLWNTVGTSAEAVRQWLGSADHRANILGEGFRLTGTGVGYDRYLRRYYVVQVFTG